MEMDFNQTFTFRNGYELVVTDTGRDGNKVSIRDPTKDVDENENAVLLPPDEVRRLVEWFSQSQCYDKKDRNRQTGFREDRAAHYEERREGMMKDE